MIIFLHAIAGGKGLLLDSKLYTVGSYHREMALCNLFLGKCGGHSPPISRQLCHILFRATRNLPPRFAVAGFRRETLRVTLRSMNVSETTTNSNGYAIRAERVSRRYRMGDAQIRAVNEISLQVGTGEFLALLGASGSGKSTLLNLMAGLDRPSSGTILALGQDLATMSSQDLATHRNRTIGIVFQSFQLLPRMTLEENVELPLRLAEVPRADRAARVREALERVGLAARTQHRPTELSGGEQQRAAIARALVNQPMILLADEPTGNLDSKTGEEIMSLIAQIHRPPSGAGRTIVMVTHERLLAERYADRIVTMSDGAIAREERLR
jgi:putative ABC transport system ATP-binding protein